MKEQNSDTRQRIINTAGPIFADLGFENTTIREICKKAGVNIAAVNYYFGDKKKLYLAVLKYGKDIVFCEHPFEENSGKPTSAEDRFKLFVSWYIGRVKECHAGYSWVRKLVTYELLRPTEGLDLVAEEGVAPIFRILSSIVRELVGTGATDDMVKMCCASVISQSLFFFYAQPMIKRLFPGDNFSNAELIAEHIVKFSLGALKNFQQTEETNDESFRIREI